jgi:hypothetical protein
MVKFGFFLEKYFYFGNGENLQKITYYENREDFPGLLTISALLLTKSGKE